MNKKNLPVPFLEMMSSLLGEEFEDYIKSFEKKRYCGIRLNTSKIQPKDFESITPFKVERVPWIPNGYFYEEDLKPAKHAYYYAGLYYIQEPSAMTPANLLPVCPGDMVLDLCAAPGGKSTELGVRLKGRGLLVANDISNSRAKALLKNLELFGIPNICVTSEAPEKLKTAFPEFFDKILVDAPCSGEGMFRKDGDMIKSWLEHGPDYYAAIQREILESAVGMLKPGGLLLYSTCTFSPVEDEETISYVLSLHEELELAELPLFEGASRGIGLDGCMRLFPHKIQGEGHFLALLRKKGQASLSVSLGTIGRPLDKGELKEFLQFTALMKRTFHPERIRVIQDLVYELPEGFDPKINLRYLRTGLLLGTIKNGRFEPGQALAMVLTQEEFSCSLSFSREDDRVIRYLKGETISLHEEEDSVQGWCLLCVDQYPLGFVKGTGRMLKNKYYPGWRWQ